MIDDSSLTGSDALEDGPPPPYGVCQPGRLPSERLAFVDDLHRQFLQQFSQALSGYIDTPVQMTPGEIEQLPVAEFLKVAATDACVVTLSLAPMSGQSWVSLSPGFLFRVLDILLGAPQTVGPQAVAAPVRSAVTDIEVHVLREFFQILHTALENAWSAGGVGFAIASTGAAPELRQVADPDGTTLVMGCKARIGEVEGTMHVAIPVLAVRLAALLCQESANNRPAEDNPARSAVLSALGSATLLLEATLSGSAIRMSELAAIKPGQVLTLGQPADSPLECRINGKVKFLGEWVANGNRHALQVDSLVQPVSGGGGV